MVEITIIGILLILLIAWRSYILATTKFGAPFVPMDPDVVERVMEYADIKPGKKFYELGSGDGRLVIQAALRGAKAYGIEIDLLRVLYSRAWIYILRLEKQAKIIHDNFFNINLSDADIVCLYLLQSTNEALQSKLEKELKKGTKVISVAFDFPGWKPKVVDPNGTIYGPLFVYER